jgi:hypothetical protein
MLIVMDFYTFLNLDEPEQPETEPDKQQEKKTCLIQ